MLHHDHRVLAREQDVAQERDERLCHAVFAVVRRSRTGRRGLNTRRVVMLTSDCFKTLCMQSKSPQADRVRAYFIAVEKTLFRYRSEIVEGMQRRIQQLENNQRPLDASLKRTGVVYVIRAADDVTARRMSGVSGMLGTRSIKPVERVRLGYTSQFPKRLRSHSSARADALEVVFVYKTDDMVAVEACAKGVLRGKVYRKYKEVYEADMDAIKATIEGCGRLVSKVQRPIPRRGSSTGGSSSEASPRTFMAFVYA